MTYQFFGYYRFLLGMLRQLYPPSALLLVGAGLAWSDGRSAQQREPVRVAAN